MPYYTGPAASLEGRIIGKETDGFSERRWNLGCDVVGCDSVCIMAIGSLVALDNEYWEITT